MNPHELQAHLQEVAAQRHLAAQDHIHQRNDFFEKLPKDQLDLVDTMLLQAVNDNTFGHYLRGIIAEIQRRKGFVCTCGHDHDAEAAAAFGAPADPDKSNTPGVDTTTPDGVGSDTEPGALSGAARDAAMREYGLEQVNPADQPDHPTGLRCINCHQVYVSLEDRMLREPGMDGCGGCQVKSAHGGWQGP